MITLKARHQERFKHVVRRQLNARMNVCDFPDTNGPSLYFLAAKRAGCRRVAELLAASQRTRSIIRRRVAGIAGGAS